MRRVSQTPVERGQQFTVAQVLIHPRHVYPELFVALPGGVCRLLARVAVSIPLSHTPGDVVLRIGAPFFYLLNYSRWRAWTPRSCPAARLSSGSIISVPCTGNDRVGGMVAVVHQPAAMFLADAGFFVHLAALQYHFVSHTSVIAGIPPRMYPLRQAPGSWR